MSDELIDPAHVARDAKLVRMAIAKGWNIPAYLLDELPETMGRIALSDEQKGQDRIAAAKVLVAMKERNDKLVRHRRPRQPMQNTVVVIGDQLDEAKRAIAARFAHLCDNSGGSSGDTEPARGSGG